MARLGSRVTIERGVYRDDSGFEVVARAGRLTRSRRYPAKTSLKTMRAWRDATATELRDEAQPTTDARTIAGAIDYYIRTVKPDDASQLRAWALVFGALERRKLTAARAQLAIDTWQQEGYSRQTLRLRKIALRKLWRALDGPTVKTPVDHIRLPKPPRRRPQWVPDDIINAVALELLKHEGLRQLRTPKTRARFLVMASTGQRPAQLRRARREDVDLERGVWHVRPAKGGEAIPLYLNDEQKAAWRLFFHARAWGDFDKRNFARVLTRCGWPKGIRPYNLRHATAMTLRKRGADLGDIQDAFGHADIATTRVYAHVVEERLQDVSARLEGRFSWAPKGISVAPVRGTRKRSA
jgi:integrase/recombinase XerD